MGDIRFPGFKSRQFSSLMSNPRLMKCRGNKIDILENENTVKVNVILENVCNWRTPLLLKKDNDTRPTRLNTSYVINITVKN